MNANENADFFKVLADAVTARREAARLQDPSTRDHAAWAKSIASLQSKRGWYRSRKQDGKINWVSERSYYFDVIRGGTASWGFVDDWADGDDTAFRRRGIIVELCFDVTKAFLKPERRDRDDKQSYIRVTIGLAMLLIASDPSALKPFLLIGSGLSRAESCFLYEDELSALARGVPWELRVKFMFGSFHTPLLLRRFHGEFMAPYDHEVLGIYERENQFEMLQDLIDWESPALERLSQLASRSTIRATLVIDASDKSENSVLASEDFFECLPPLISDLDRYQSRRKPRKWCRCAPFRVDKIELQLGQMHVTPRVVRFATALTRARIPVQLSRLALDLRFLACPERDLRKFVQVITSGAAEVGVDSGRNNKPKEATKPIDAEGQDRHKKIRTVMSAIAETKRIRHLDLTGILWMCAAPINRQAVWRGLFEDVLSGDIATDTMALRISNMKPPVSLTEHDAKFIADSAEQWRQANPGKMLRLRHLELHFGTIEMSAVRALLSAFHDVKELTLHFHVKIRYGPPLPQKVSSDALTAILRYPSLESLDLKGICIPTMDLFNPSIADPRLPAKASLRRLNLSRLQLEDPTSFHRFLDQLKSTVPSLSAKKLQQFKVKWIGSTPIVDLSALTTLDEILTSNTTLRHVVFSTASADRVQADEIASKHYGRILPASGDQESHMAKSRKIAFLSSIHDRHSGDANAARFRLDSALVSKIFAYSATRVVRTVESTHSWD